MDSNDLPQISKKVRRQILEMIYQAGSGHLAGSLSSTDLLVSLYFGGILNKNDKFVLSCGHYAPALYAVLANAGKFPEKELKTFGQLGTRLQTHPHNLSLPGIETSSGPLGLGLAQAAGMAMGIKPNRIYCLMSDGEQDEGGVWETVMFAAKYKLDNLVAIIDKNGIQIDGKTSEIMPTEDLAAKYISFGWEVFEIDGHVFGQVLNALEFAKTVKDKPVVIIARTIAGKGVSFMEGKWEWHYASLSKELFNKALKELR
ncbi:transketolase [Candidatus Shapirobacteria bacterium CG08_land_8_20_14_0_20_39_18]|uniref:Transketolase n=1 Tax=Candidatus Shapirobacteria bacterium CG08_land_8_20_14_0_20_39_18 TaxID=1974883 RepID=A0A2M6XDF5_9BACT|nr:MAG: transketolase [Candidatus Shapirobacteria bacterium CG08_land_8_20_14_0_20_39_18]PIY64769.1 MAG: transketolase [Candidatus Shapirobacteria bacterium CG_4_10_14_0_8_um_filter_39_15]PJE67896.1 MAG: transketolase [Candidatus Shapirobacteria bacterium CG10_big_fil_rev_8_21_14_0_10_38_8]